MAASAEPPGDVNQEREALEDAIGKINRECQSNIFLQTFTWKQDVVPRIGPSPQEVIDGQTPPCDIYLGIMSARFGTPTKQHDQAWSSAIADQ